MFPTSKLPNAVLSKRRSNLLVIGWSTTFDYWYLAASYPLNSCGSCKGVSVLPTCTEFGENFLFHSSTLLSFTSKSSYPVCLSVSLRTLWWEYLAVIMSILIILKSSLHLFVTSCRPKCSHSRWKPSGQDGTITHSHSPCEVSHFKSLSALFSSLLELALP